MRVVLPHILESIAELPATRVMRGWMESVTRLISTANTSYSANVTTTGNMYIRATSPITITLRSDAIEDESVTVHHDSATGYPQVTDGFGTDILTIRGTVISYKFKIDEGWVRGA